jgi:ankyrin repeat protein
LNYSILGVIVIQTSSGALNPIQALIDAGAKVNATNNAKAAAIHKAANNGQRSVVALLINCGAVVDIQDSQGNTPMVRECAQHRLI